jgi:serine/threonine-protein kinase
VAGKTLFDVTSPRVSEPNLGAVLAGRYRLLRVLGSGQMARVYVAEQLAMARNVAVKVMRDELRLDEVAVQRFRREVGVVARLRSPHTIQCHDAGESDDHELFIAMELLAGETLRQRLERERVIVPDEVVQIAAQIGASLQEAHDAGVLHRDLKPENVFFCSHPSPLRPFVKVLDFGLAKLVSPEPGSLRLTDPHRTVGTPAYIAPEMVVRGRAIDHRADIYALGVMCFEMLTGERPFCHATPMAMAIAHVTQRIPRASEVNPSLPVAVDSFFESVLAKTPASRPADAGEVAERLAAALA